MKSTQPEQIHEGKNLRFIRTFKGIKQQVLADEMTQCFGIKSSQKQISQLEGMMIIPPRLLKHILNVLDVSETFFRSVNPVQPFNNLNQIDTAQSTPAYEVNKWCFSMVEDFVNDTRCLNSQLHKQQLSHQHTISRYKRYLRKYRIEIAVLKEKIKKISY